MQFDYSNRTSAGQIIAQPLPRLKFVFREKYIEVAGIIRHMVFNKHMTNGNN